MTGPESATGDRIAVFDGATGKAVKDGGASIADLDTRGKQAIYVPAAAMRPSSTGGCASSRPDTSWAT